MLAQMMAGNSSSRLLALDRTAAKAARIRQLADSWGVGDVVQVMAADATQLYQQDTLGQQGLQQAEPVTGDSGTLAEQVDIDSTESTLVGTSSSTSGSGSGPSSSNHGDGSSRRKRRKASDQEQQQPCAELLAAAQPESFDAVLLDAPCSALGLRPRLLMDWRLPQLESLAGYQRALLHAAVHVLRPVGSLVYCTCTINPGESPDVVCTLGYLLFLQQAAVRAMSARACERQFVSKLLQ
jgi:16S rRNA C967 or C1407 C5-methylase (RsmB/RsmF family)